KSLTRTTQPGVVDCHSVHLRKITVAGIGQRCSKVARVTSVGVRAPRLSYTAGGVYARAGIAITGCYQTFIERNQSTQGFIGGTRLVSALYGPINKRAGHIEHQLRIVFSFIRTSKIVGVKYRT